MNFKCYNTDDEREEDNFRIYPDGIITSDWGKDKPHWKLLLGSDVMDGDREIFEHDLYIDEQDSLHEVVFQEGGFWLEAHFSRIDNLLSLCEIRQSGLRYIGNAYINPDVYEKYTEKDEN